MACVHAATAKASTTAKCLITLSSLQWLTMANNDGDGDQFNRPGSQAQARNVISHAVSIPRRKRRGMEERGLDNISMQSFHELL
jgi:hypothetical protein